MHAPYRRLHRVRREDAEGKGGQASASHPNCGRCVRSVERGCGAGAGASPNAVYARQGSQEMHDPADSRVSACLGSRYSVYFLYWYKSTNNDAAAAAGVAEIAQDKRISRRAAVEGVLRDLKTRLRELSAELVEPFKQNLEASRMFQSECERTVKEAWERMLWQRERGRETVYARRVRRMLARAFVDFCDSVVRVMEQSSWQWARLYRLLQLHVAVQDVQVERRQERERERESKTGRPLLS
jgi:hypothetical protein